jgi:hypothetical protein
VLSFPTESVDFKTRLASLNESETKMTLLDKMALEIGIFLTSQLYSTNIIIYFLVQLFIPIQA